MEIPGARGRLAWSLGNGNTTLAAWRCWVVALLLTACSGASWRSVDVASPYQPPQAMTVHVSGRPAWNEASEALGTAILEGLASHGIQATLVYDTKSKPNLLINVQKWDPGSRAVRWIGFGGGKGEIVVEVETMNAAGQPILDGEAEGWVRGGFFGGSAINSASALGSLIAKAVATGKAEAPPERPED